MRLLVSLAARRSDRVIVPSRATQDDLVRCSNVPPRRSTSCRSGSEWRRRTGTDEDELRRRPDLGRDRSSSRPRRSDRTRISSGCSTRSRASRATRRPALVMPGYATPYEQGASGTRDRLGLETDVRFLGWVSADELEGLYARASCFVFPSLYEGFGLPVLEAMARGVPVACSDRGSLAEVPAGNAALVFDPESPQAIADAIERLLVDRGRARPTQRRGPCQRRRGSHGRRLRGERC